MTGPADGPPASRQTIERLLNRLLELEEPGPAARVHEALADAGPGGGLRDALAATDHWLRSWLGDVPGWIHTLAAGLSGLDLLTCFDAGLPQAEEQHAVLALLAETVLLPTAESLPGPPARAHLMAVAERQGWRLVRQQDLSTPLAEFRQRWVRALQRHQRALQAAGLDVVAGLQQLQHSIDGLRAGLHGGEALHFERATRPAQQLVRVDAERSLAMRSLFLSVFGHEMTEAHWRWKYGGGRGAGVALEQDGRLLAHYGGQTRELRVFGQPQWGCQICDVMVTPQANRSLLRKGPMQQVAATFLETQIGWGLPHQFGFGFPSDRHHFLADKLGLYVGVDSIAQVSWTAAPTPQLGRFDVADLAPRQAAFTAPTRSALNRLWHAMALDMQDLALGVRDADWLKWRYLDHPTAHYRLTLVRSRWLKRDVGLLVTREHEDAVELIDLVAPTAHFGTLVHIARGQAAAAGKPVLRAWITRSQLHRLADIGDPSVRVDDPHICVPANRHTAGPAPELLKNRWFLMAGDADFK